MIDSGVPAFSQIITFVGYAVETVGVIVIVAGSIWATGRTLASRSTESRERRNQSYRRDLARSMLLGLEFLVAGDIIRTVIVAHSIADVASLGLIVLIRTVLVFTITLEVEGHWPWQGASKSRGDAGG